MDADEVAPCLNTVPEGSELENGWRWEKQKNNNSVHVIESARGFHRHPISLVLLLKTWLRQRTFDKAEVRVLDWWGRPLISVSLGLIRG